MDDARIRQLTEEVLEQLRGGGGGPAAASDLEARVAALETAFRALQAALGAPTATGVAVAHAHAPERVHPSLRVLGVSSGAERCVLEPDKPCVQSGQCRALGH